MTEACSYDDVTDILRFNDLLDAITEKRFLSPTIFVQAVRGACDLHGITLPLLDIEGMDGPTSDESKGILYGVASPTAPAMYAAPVEGEYVFHIERSDCEVQDLHLFMIVDRDDQGLYECYAQIVDHDDLQDLLNLEKHYPELVGDVSGETDYLKQTRHSTGDVVDDQPPQE